MKTTALILLQLLASTLMDAQVSVPNTVAPYCVGLKVDGAAKEWDKSSIAQYIHIHVMRMLISYVKLDYTSYSINYMYTVYYFE